MKKMLILVLFVALAGFIFSGCGDKEDSESTAAGGPAGSLTADPNQMVAAVNGKVITAGTLQGQTNMILQQYAAQMPPAQLNQLRPMLQQQALASLINQTLLLEAADQAGIVPGDEEVEEELDKIIEQFPSREEFDQRLTAAGATVADVERDIRQNLKIKLLLDEKVPPAEVSEEEVETFYAENPDQFKEPEQVAASHILIGYQGAMRSDSELTKDEARARAEEVRDKAGMEGADFAALAEEYSDGPTATSGGSLGYFGKGQMTGAFEDAAFAMESGEISDVVETEFGYHVIKVTDHKKERTIPLEEVREKVVTFLDSQNRQQEIADYLQSLRAEAAIEYAPGFEPRQPAMPSGPPPVPASAE